MGPGAEPRYLKQDSGVLGAGGGEFNGGCENCPGGGEVRSGEVLLLCGVVLLRSLHVWAMRV